MLRMVQRKWCSDGRLFSGVCLLCCWPALSTVEISVLSQHPNEVGVDAVPYDRSRNRGTERPSYPPWSLAIRIRAAWFQSLLPEPNVMLHR